jgi:hypothetical protein
LSDFTLVSGVFGAMGALPGAVLGAAAGIDAQYDLTGPKAEQRWQSFLQEYGNLKSRH